MKLVFNSMRSGAWKTYSLPVPVFLSSFCASSLSSWVPGSICTWQESAMVYDGVWSVSYSNRENTPLGKKLSADSEGCSLTGAGQLSSFTFREISTVTVSLTFHWPFQNMNGRKLQCLPFLFKYFMSVWKMFKRLVFMWAWAEGVQSHRHDSGWLHFSPSWFREQPKLEVNFWTALVSRTRSWNWHRGAHLWKICLLVAQPHLCHIGWVVWAWNQRRSSPAESLCPVPVLILYRFLWSTPQPEKLLPRKYGVTL